MIVSVLILFGFYFLCMMVLLFGFLKIPIHHSNVKPSKTRFSLVVPFRNESENLPILLRSMANLNYPTDNLEIIFVDDFSDDTSVEIVEKMKITTGFPIRLIENKRSSNSPKKDAISDAIKNAEYEWIVTTDADCELPPDWLKALDSFIQANNGLLKKPVMVCAPVVYGTNGTFLEDYQFLDGLSLQFATIGSFGMNRPILCNGANLAYRKNAFENVNGFYGNDHQASGDDVFLLEKMQKTFPGQVRFLKSKEAIVSTKPQNSWENVLQQRIRWGAKTGKLKNPFSLFLGVLVFLVNLLMLAIPVLMVFDWKNWVVWSTLFFAKTILDYCVLSQTALFFGAKLSVLKIVLMSFVYAAITTQAVFGSFKGSYSWKGRTYRVN